MTQEEKIKTGRGWRAIHTVVSLSILVALIFVTLLAEIVIHTLDDDEWHSPAERIISDITMIGSSYDHVEISPYDDIFREVSSKYGNHWCLIAAICYVESRFQPNVKSYSGAVGLMQIMPRTGRIYGVSVAELSDVRTNVEIGNLHLNYIEQMLSLPDDTRMRDRICFILASYNGGIGRLFDAQRLTREAGLDPHIWSHVAPNMLRLSREEGYANPLVRFGRFSAASYTVRYVADVLAKYDEYLELSFKCRNNARGVVGPVGLRP